MLLTVGRGDSADYPGWAPDLERHYLIDIERSLDMVLFKASVLQEAHLLCFGLEVWWYAGTEFSQANIAGEFKPVCRIFLYCTLNSAIPDSSLTQIQSNSDGALALIDTRLNESLGESLVVLQAIFSEFANSLLGHAAVVALVRELPDEFGLSVFSSGQKIHGLLASFDRTRKTIFPHIGEKIADFFVNLLQLCFFGDCCVVCCIFWFRVRNGDDGRWHQDGTNLTLDFIGHFGMLF